MIHCYCSLATAAIFVLSCKLVLVSYFLYTIDENVNIRRDTSYSAYGNQTTPLSDNALLVLVIYQPTLV